MKSAEVFAKRRRLGENFSPRNRILLKQSADQTPVKSMTTNKLQISGHSMGQELELPRPNFNRNYQ